MMVLVVVICGRLIMSMLFHVLGFCWAEAPGTILRRQLLAVVHITDDVPALHLLFTCVVSACVRLLPLPVCAVSPIDSPGYANYWQVFRFETFDHPAPHP